MMYVIRYKRNGEFLQGKNEIHGDPCTTTDLEHCARFNQLKTVQNLIRKNVKYHLDELERIKNLPNAKYKPGKTHKWLEVDPTDFEIVELELKLGKVVQ